MRLYQFCYENLDWFEVREYKTMWISERMGMHESEVSRALSQLIEWGYIIEHPRSHRTKPRRLTIASSVREDLRTA